MRKILISENEKSRILGLHENRRIKEWGLINEEMIYIKNDKTGQATMVNGPFAPVGSTKIDKVEFDAINNLLGTEKTPVVSAPEPFIPNGYDSINGCKADYNTSFLYGISMKVLGQNHLAIQKKWISSGCNGKTPCNKTSASNKNLAMAICEGTFNINASTVTAPINTRTLLNNELKAKNIKITGLQDPPRGEFSSWSLTDGSRINVGYYGFFVNSAENTAIYYMDNGMTLKADQKNTTNDDELPYAILPNWTDKPIDGAKTTAPVVDAPMKTLTPTSVSSTATQLGLAGTSGVTGTSGVAGTSGVVDTTNMASAKDIRQGYRQGKRDVRELKRELRKYQNTLQRLANKMTTEQKKQYETKIAQLQIQINKSAT